MTNTLLNRIFDIISCLKLCSTLWASGKEDAKDAKEAHPMHLFALGEGSVTERKNSCRAR